MNKLLLSFVFFIIACNSDHDRSKTQNNVSVQWQYLTLELSDTAIQVTKTIDALEIATVKNGVQKYSIQNSEKDSLFSWSNKLIDFKGQPKCFCTDYVGKFKVRIRYNPQLLKEVSFSSLCNWQEIDPNTIKIHKLLKGLISAK